MREVSGRNLAHDECVHGDFAPFECRCQSRVMETQMVDPDRRIDDDDFFMLRRRGIGFIRGSLPPSLASLRAASRAPSERSASFSGAVRSSMPVRRRASASTASSRLTVVRMATFGK